MVCGTELRCGAEDGRQVLAVIGGRYEQQTLRRLRQHEDTSQERRLHPLRQGQGLGQRLGTGQLARRQSAWQLEQRQRVTARLLNQLFAHSGRHRQARALEQGCRRSEVEPTERHQAQVCLVEPPALSGPRPCQNRDSFRAQSPRHEQECVGRRSIQPVRVINQAQQRTILRGRRQQ